jgi:nitroreductase
MNAPSDTVSADPTMDALGVILTRASAPRFYEPGPTPDQLKQILEAAVRAPDHGRLEPWRFVVLEGEARERLGKAMADALRRQAPDTSPEALEREAAKALRAPTIVAVAARISVGKIRDIEQILAVGAAVQNMLLAAHALGLGAAWKTGAAAYEPNVKTAIGLLADDHIVAFVYLGTQERSPPLHPVSLDGRVSRI